MKSIKYIYSIALFVFASLSMSVAQNCRANYLHIQGSGTDVAFINKSEGSVNEVEWTFGDGKSSDKLNVVHTYDKPGYYLMKLSVTDKNNATDELFKIIHVHSQEELLAASAGNANFKTGDYVFSARSKDMLFDCFDKFFEDAIVLKPNRKVPSF